MARAGQVGSPFWAIHPVYEKHVCGRGSTTELSGVRNGPCSEVSVYIDTRRGMG